MKLKNSFKRILMIVLGLSALLVLKLYNEEHISPFNPNIYIDSDLILRMASSDDTNFILASNKLYISDQNNNIKHIVTINDGNTLINDVETHNGSFFISTYDFKDNSSCIATEKIMELDSNGKIVSTVYEIDYPEETNNLGTVIDTFNVSENGIYYTDINENEVDIVRVQFENANNQPELYTFDTITVDAPVITTFYDSENSQIYVQTFWNDVYSYSFDNNTPKLLSNTERDIYETLIKSQNSEILHVNGNFAAKNIAFWLSCFILAIFALVFVIRLLIMLPFNKARVPIIMALFLIVSIGMFSQMLMESHRQSQEKLLSGISNTIMAEISGKDIVKKADTKDILKNMDDPDFQVDILDFQNLASDICLANNNVTSMYVMGYFIDESEDFNIAFSSFGHYPFGKKVHNKNFQYIPGTQTQIFTTRSFIETDIVALTFLTDETNKLKFCVEAGATDAIQLSEIMKLVGMKVLHLVAFLAFMWSLFDCYHIFIEDFKRFKTHRQDKSYGGGSAYDLASIYVFIVNIILNLDFVLLVFVVNRICEGLSPAELAIMFSIPFTAYGVGGFIGSIVTAPIIRLLGRRKAAIVSAFGTIVIYIGMAMACVVLNIYILTICKFFEGIFVRSLLSTIGEGIPYDIEDEEERKKGIVSVNSVVSGSIIVGTMISGFFQQYIGFSIVYMIGAGLGIVLLILSYVIFNKNEEKVDGERTKTILGSWGVYLKPRSLVYLITFILIYAFMTGYTEFIFPLLVGSANLGEMALADMSILATTATLIGVEKLIPKDRYSPMQLMKLSFTTVGICLLVVFMQPSLEVAFIVLLLIGLFSRPLFNYRVLEMTKVALAYGVDEKDIQENYYAIENGICMLQAPVLGPLCNISVALACGVVGVGCVILPNLYTRISNHIRVRSK